ncbi:hypothetical protein VNO80_01192 [Phaseolus coccineus]|uniref:Uncharacterized protein n=1 Tax=Phaseolus coccineus TaxID=3886 RepID=A0AAN9RQS3_PHACN
MIPLQYVAEIRDPFTKERHWLDLVVEDLSHDIIAHSHSESKFGDGRARNLVWNVRTVNEKTKNKVKENQ